MTKASVPDREPRATRFGVDGTGIASDLTIEMPVERAPRRIVVGIDGSAESLIALRRAARIRQALNATVETIAVWRFPGYFGSMITAGWNPEGDSEQLLTDTVAAVFDGDAPDWLVKITRQGNPAEVLIQASEGAAMLVIGSRGHGGFAGLLLGSVSMACAEHARCPVLIMHQSKTHTRGGYQEQK